MPFIATKQKEAQKYLAHYQSCTAEEQAVLRVLAVVFETVNQTKLNRILEAATIKKLLNQTAGEPKMNAAMKNSFSRQGLIAVEQSGLKLAPQLLHVLMEKCREQDDLPGIFKAVYVEMPLSPRYNSYYITSMQKERQVREQFYLQNWTNLLPMMMSDDDPNREDRQAVGFVINCLFCPYDETEFEALPPMIRGLAIEQVIRKMRDDRRKHDDIIELLVSLTKASACDDKSRVMLVEHYLFNEQLDDAAALIKQMDVHWVSLALSGWLAFAQGDMDLSIGFFEQCKVAKNKVKRRTRQYVGGLPGVFYCLALLKSGYQGEPARLNQLITETGNVEADKKYNDDDKSWFSCLGTQARIFNGKSMDTWHLHMNYYRYSDSFSFQWSLLLSALCFSWQKKKLPDRYQDKLKNFFAEAADVGDFIYARAAARILNQGKTPYLPARAFLNKNWSNATDLYDLVKPKEKWLQALDQLIALDTQPNADGSDVAGNEKPMRMAWFLHETEFSHKLEAREQKKGKKAWTKGRVVALTHLYERPEEYDYLTPADHIIIQAISKEVESSYYGYGKDVYALGGYPALRACVNHPSVFMANNIGQAIEIVASDPELLITESGKGFKVFMPGIPEDLDEMDQMYSFEQESGHRYRLVQFNQKHRQIAEIVGEKGLNIPKNAKQKVIQSLKAVAPLLNIQSDIAGIGEVDTGIEQTEPDQRLYINIQPAGGGLQMEIHVQPLGENGPCLLPGSGNSMVVAQIDDKRLATNRDLKVEKRQFEQLQDTCPMFNYLSDQVLVLDELEDALNCLEQLENIHHSESEPNIVLQWPKGQAVKMTKTADRQQMNLQVGKQKDWFALDGQLHVDEGEVIELKNLLKLVAQSNGRFIRLEDNKFLALTEQLRKQLDDIAGITLDGKFHSLAAPVIDDVIEGMKLKSNKAWQQQRKKLKESFALEPQLPATLMANLRDYQVDGYQWASRLSHWDGGACLADDMGLGKTLQALAVILSRAAVGPTLVLAPTSVCFNWQDEALRFAPTLNVKLFSAGVRKDRSKVLQELGPFDVVVCSYGLLATEGEQLAKVKWHTMVADEAQAIKNPAAKRTQMAMKLEADFAMITTGTPIENNLTELWSLFRFINAGLLGSQEQFNKRFANPIENANDGDLQAKTASQALRKLISPFILRRLKSDVLTELPSRTEINLHVELSEEETVFYEALRQKAMETMLEKTEDKAGQKRIKILAEIMRLRRACCHPSLVMEDSPIAGSKLKVFDGLIDELKQGNHKALVFSQFVGHLAILRDHLEEKGINFQYLDGSTPAAKRKEAVNAFQAGEGDLFLISLKAGGAGLNLTAADYVIHMDPWWNPAVEDQASDRAHRMGQTRPVTIYRLITQNTIEDKIVALHQQKRDLANSLLEGADSSGNLTFEDMMNLLKPQ